MRGWKRCATLFLLAALPGCVRWKAVTVPTPPAPPNVVADRTRIRLTSGRNVEFLTLVVATDSLFGIRNNLGRTRLTVGLDQVSRIEVREKDPVRTVALIGAIGIALFLSGGLGYRLK